MRQHLRLIWIQPPLKSSWHITLFISPQIETVISISFSFYMFTGYMSSTLKTNICFSSCIVKLSVCFVCMLQNTWCNTVKIDSHLERNLSISCLIFCMFLSLQESVIYGSTSCHDKLAGMDNFLSSNLYLLSYTTILPLPEAMFLISRIPL